MAEKRFVAQGAVPAIVRLDVALYGPCNVIFGELSLRASTNADCSICPDLAGHIRCNVIGCAGPQTRDCRPLQEIASLTMSLLPDGSRVVPLIINGKPVNLLVDTGAGMSSLTDPAATVLDMTCATPIRASGRQGWTPVRSYYIADTFQVGPLPTRGIPFLQDGAEDETLPGGTMGPDLMVRYDVEMDFAENKMIYFSPDHCPGHILHWSGDAVAQVPIRITSASTIIRPRCCRARLWICRGTSCRT